MKRAFDAIVSGVALAALSPCLLLLAVILRVRHGSPVLFRQTRVGLRGELFSIHKFRTMDSARGPSVTSDGDVRVHATGSLLRATKLDELPQLWDVARGKMSLVGPRPEVPKFAAHWPPEDREVILSVRPGITDPASIKFRHESDLLAGLNDPEATYISTILPEKCRIYVEYVSTASFRGDLRILFKTAAAVLKRPGGTS